MSQLALISNTLSTLHHENMTIYYLVKLGFIGVNVICLISAQNIGSSNEYPQSTFWAEIWKISEFLSETFSFWWWNFHYIWIGVFSKWTDSFVSYVIILFQVDYTNNSDITVRFTLLDRPPPIGNVKHPKLEPDLNTVATLLSTAINNGTFKVKMTPTGQTVSL